MDHPRPTLRYVEAKALADTGVKLNGLEVDGIDGEKLGKVEGFIIDIATGRPYHIVVGAGGWFTHKHFLLPVGHAMLNSDGTKLIADLTKERVKRFPGFDKSKFEKLTDEDMRQLDEAMAAACCPDEVVVVETWEVGGHYRYPDWWQASYYQAPVGDRRG
jgi:sporulation protein YlmC with PRC-barrel domain